jgi:hypothetical protein
LNTALAGKLGKTEVAYDSARLGGLGYKYYSGHSNDDGGNPDYTSWAWLQTAGNPVAGYWCIFSCFNENAIYRGQLAIECVDSGTPRVYVRGNHNGWSDWGLLTSSVNGQTGEIVLNAEDVEALPAKNGVVVDPVVFLDRLSSVNLKADIANPNYTTTGALSLGEARDALSGISAVIREYDAASTPETPDPLDQEVFSFEALSGLTVQGVPVVDNDGNLSVNAVLAALVTVVRDLAGLS